MLGEGREGDGEKVSMYIEWTLLVVVFVILECMCNLMVDGL